MVFEKNRILWKLLFLENRRSKSEAHEASWYNIIGYLLRPGCGEEQDQHRVQNMWGLFQAGTQNSSSV